ncbi:MAG: pilus assembly protein PilM [Phycisphaerae bacterium]|jgi:Tfp pilus assembly PilM family ATPase
MKSLGNPRRGRTPIGLDIGECGVRAVQLIRSGDRFTVQSMAQLAWNVNPAEPAPPAPHRAARVQSCLGMGTFNGRDAIAALNPPAVEFHALELPKTATADGKTDLSEVVRWELKRLATQSDDDVEARHWPLPATNAAAPNAIGVAARRSVISDRIDLCKQAHLLCAQLDTGATALSRVGGILNTWDAKEVWGVLDLGYHDARLVLCVDDVPVLVRRAGAGGRDWTQRIADALQVGHRAAEVHKCDHGIALSARGVRKTSDAERSGGSEPPGDQLAAILLGALRADLRDLATEIKRSYEYVLSCYPDRRAADLMLAGGGAAMRHLPDYLNSLLGIPVHCASEYLRRDTCRLEYASGKQTRLEGAAMAIGLAVGT